MRALYVALVAQAALSLGAPVAMAGGQIYQTDGTTTFALPSLAPTNRKESQVQAAGKPPYPGYYYETAASLACIYQLVPQVAACDPNMQLNNNQYYGANAIIVVTQYHSPNLATDLAAYSTQFSLPAPNLTVVYGNGSSASPTNCTATGPSSYADGKFSCQTYTTDPLEIAHAMAPAAKLIVVETASTTAASLAQALDVANQQAGANGGGEIIITPEFAEVSATTTTVEPHLTTASGVIYFAPSGYLAGLTYPGTSPNVVSVGSTSISRAMGNPASVGQFRLEGASVAGAGGFSTVFPAPSFQAGIAARLGGINKRAVPDIAATNNNNANIWVYNSGGWYVVGSEEVAAGIVAGIANAAQATATNPTTAQELNYIYARVGTSSFFDVSVGDCGNYDGNYATAVTTGNPASAWDPCTGVGSPRGLSGLGAAVATASYKRASATGGAR